MIEERNLMLFLD